MTFSHSHPGIRISELPLIRAVGTGDYVVINDNDSTTTKISFSDFIQSIHNIKGEVDLKVYAEDVIIKSPGADTDPLWEEVGGYVPIHQDEANNIFLTELGRLGKELEDLTLIVNELKENDGRYVTKDYVDEQIRIEREERQEQDEILMNIKADKYNTYTKEEVDALAVCNLSVDNRTETGFDVVSSNGDDATLPFATPFLAGLITAEDQAKLDTIEEDAAAFVPTDLSIFNRNNLTLDVLSSTGTDATIPAATKTLAGLISGDDKAKLDTLTRTVDFYGSVDLTDAATIPNRPNPLNGDAYVNTGTGTVAAGWAVVSDLNTGEQVTAGDIVIWNGTDWTYIPTGGIQYTDADVDAHLNTGSSGDDYVLSWNGTDYEWVDPDHVFTQNLQDVTDQGNITTNNILIGTDAAAPKIELKSNGSADFADGDIVFNSDGSGSFTKKVTSESTEDSDSGITLVTKDYIDAAIAGEDLQAVCDIGSVTTTDMTIGGPVGINAAANDYQMLAVNGSTNGLGDGNSTRSS